MFFFLNFFLNPLGISSLLNQYHSQIYFTTVVSNKAGLTTFFVVGSIFINTKVMK